MKRSMASVLAIAIGTTIGGLAAALVACACILAAPDLSLRFVDVPVFRIVITPYAQLIVLLTEGELRPGPIADDTALIHALAIVLMCGTFGALFGGAAGVFAGLRRS